MHWLLAYTKPSAEWQAQEHLERQGFEVLCPMLRAQKIRRGKWVWVHEPLFPRYLFVGVTEDQSWAPIRSTVGITSLVKFGGIFAEVPSTLIDLLRVGAEKPEGNRPLFRQGEKLRIVAGPFASFEAVFEMDQGDQRATVLLDLLGRQSRVTVDVGQLVPDDQP